MASKPRSAPRCSTSFVIETCVLTCEPLPPAIRKRGTAGIPMLNEVRVVDSRGAPLGAGEEGEIVARGPGVMDGYVGDPELNARAFVDGWFRTGDAGRLDQDGYLTITGRIKELINRGGEKIAPNEIERVIAGHPAVDRVCVFGIAHPTLGEEVVAAVVPAHDAVADERAIIEFAGSRLAAFKVPRRVVFTSGLPTIAAGKIDRQALARAYAASNLVAQSQAPEPEASPSPVEGDVAALWRKILNVEKVRHDTDFFLSGGDSLKITELLVAIQKRFGVRTSMREILGEGATIAGIARLIARAPIDQRCVDALPEGVMPLKVDGDRPPLFALPGSDGNPASYVHFCQLLDDRQPLYGLVSRGLDGAAKPLDRMPAIAADHIRRMRALQPTGPYFLIGRVFGGRVAYEVARQLEASGERVAFLAMLIRHRPSPIRRLGPAAGRHCARRRVNIRDCCVSSRGACVSMRTSCATSTRRGGGRSCEPSSISRARSSCAAICSAAIGASFMRRRSTTRTTRRGSVTSRDRTTASRPSCSPRAALRSDATMARLARARPAVRRAAIRSRARHRRHADPAERVCARGARERLARRSARRYAMQRRRCDASWRAGRSACLRPQPSGSRARRSQERLMITRRQVLAGTTLLIPGIGWRTGWTAPFPTKPVRLLVGHPPGGQSDMVARMIAPKLGEVLGQSVVIENRSGAAGTIAAREVAKAAPDGHTLLVCSSTGLALARVMVADLPYDPIRDFAPVARLASIPTALAVGHWIPATNAPDLVEYARARPGLLTAGSSGNGSTSGFALELLKAATGIDILQVPYGGLAPAVNALLSRHVDMAFAEFTIVGAHARTGTLRLLGTPASARFAAAPELPTLREQGLPDVVIDAWTGLVAPAGVSGETLAHIGNALSEVMRTADVRERLRDGGFEPLEDTPVQFAASVRADFRRFAAVAARLGIGPANAGASGAQGGS